MRANDALKHRAPSCLCCHSTAGGSNKICSSERVCPLKRDSMTQYQYFFLSHVNKKDSLKGDNMIQRAYGEQIWIAVQMHIVCEYVLLWKRTCVNSVQKCVYTRICMCWSPDSETEYAGKKHWQSKKPVWLTNLNVTIFPEGLLASCLQRLNSITCNCVSTCIFMGLHLLFTMTVTKWEKALVHEGRPEITHLIPHC